MLTPAVILSVQSELPDDLTAKIAAFEDSFKLLLKRSNSAAPLRLRTPRDQMVAVDPKNVHFVVNGGPSRPHVSFLGRDFRNISAVTTAQLIGSLEHELGWIDSFGFSVPLDAIINSEQLGAAVARLVNEYIKFEEFEWEKKNNTVRINPIFRGRDFRMEQDLCFVLMPFSTEHSLQEIYDVTIKPVVQAAGLKCTRADDFYDSTLIIESIWEKINKARIIVSELTGRNPNVFYELGIAHTIGKDVILLSQDVNDIPFDLRHLRAVLYTTTPKGVEDLRKQLGATLTTMLQRTTGKGS